MVHPYNRTIPIFENEYAKKRRRQSVRLRVFVIGGCVFRERIYKMVTVSHYIAKRCPYIVGGQPGLLSVSAFSGGNQLFDFGFQQGEMVDYDCPDKVSAKTVVAMYEKISGVYNTSG